MSVRHEFNQKTEAVLGTVSLLLPTASAPLLPLICRHWELLLCLVQGSPASLAAPPWTSTTFSVHEATLPWCTLLQRARLATWPGGRTLSHRPTWDSSPTSAWEESKPPPRESWGGRKTRSHRLKTRKEFYFPSYPLGLIYLLLPQYQHSSGSDVVPGCQWVTFAPQLPALVGLPGSSLLAPAHTDVLPAASRKV